MYASREEYAPARPSLGSLIRNFFRAILPEPKPITYRPTQRPRTPSPPPRRRQRSPSPVRTRIEGPSAVTLFFRWLMAPSTTTSKGTAKKQESALITELKQKLVTWTKACEQAEQVLARPNLTYLQVQEQATQLRGLLTQCAAAAAAMPAGADPEVFLDLLRLMRKIIACLLTIAKVLKFFVKHPYLLATIAALGLIDAILLIAIRSAEVGQNKSPDIAVVILEVISSLTEILMFPHQDIDSQKLKTLIQAVCKTQSSLLSFGSKAKNDTSLSALNPNLQALGRFMDKATKYFRMVQQVLDLKKSIEDFYRQTITSADQILQRLGQARELNAELGLGLDAVENGDRPDYIDIGLEFLTGLVQVTIKLGKLAQNFKKDKKLAKHLEALGTFETILGILSTSHDLYQGTADVQMAVFDLGSGLSEIMALIVSNEKSDELNELVQRTFNAQKALKNLADKLKNKELQRNLIALAGLLELVAASAGTCYMS